MSYILSLDEQLEYLFHVKLHIPVIWKIANFITGLWDLTILILCAILIFLWLSRTKNRQLQQAIFICLVTVAITQVLTWILKMSLQRIGPTPIIQPSAELLYSFLPFNPQYAFPSGHTSRAFAAATALSLKLPQYRVPLISSALLIGLSRIYLGVHYPLDVVGGALLGIAVALVVAHYQDKFKNLLPLS